MEFTSAFLHASMLLQLSMPKRLCAGKVSTVRLDTPEGGLQQLSGLLPPAAASNITAIALTQHFLVRSPQWVYT